MVANPTSSRRPRRIRLIALMCVAVPAGLIASASWWLTAPIEGDATAARRELLRLEAARSDAADPAGPHALPEWPERRIDGPAAKRFLLEYMEQAVRRLEAVEGYTATLTRQERINGVLGPEQRLRLKIQHDPFAIYLRFESPRAGKEVLYHEGRFDDHLIAHNGDWTRRLIPRLKVDPNGPIAMADNRHPVTEAGLLHLARTLLHFRRLDLDDPDAQTVLDRITDEDGRPWHRSVHTHTINNGERPFAHVVVRYSPELRIPLDIVSYDWPRPGEEGQGRLLAERYRYSDVDLDVAFSALEFDPSNPEYEFQRY